jgi:regulator of protease activity HflC (stomatin/prohibitin superfamily)
MTGSWLETIFDKISSLWPIFRVQLWEECLRTTFLPKYPIIYLYPPAIIWREARVIQKVLGPGLHRMIPWLEEEHTYGVVEDAEELPVQSLTTSDGKSISLQIGYIYRIVNIDKVTNKVQLWKDSLEKLAKMYVNDAVRNYRLDDLLSSQMALEDGIVEELNKHAKKWGVRILKVGLTNITETINYRHFGVGNILGIQS